MVALLIFLGVAVALALSWPVIVLLHELGHALTALWLLPRARVTMYVGSYGNPAGNLRLRTGRLEWVLAWRVWRWWSGLCRFEPAAGPPLRLLLIVLAGPLMSTLIIVATAYAAFHWDWHGAIKLLMVFMATFALIHLASNLWPSLTPVQLHDGGQVYNDGQLLHQYWRLHQLDGVLSAAQRHLDQQQFLPAARLLEHTLRTVGADQHRHRLVVHCYQQAGNFRRAEEWLALYLDAYPAAATEWVVMGGLRSRLGRHEDSRQAYARALDLDPRNPQAWNNCGYQLLLLEQYAQAEEYCSGALAEDPDFAFAYNNRGLARLRLGKATEALADIKKSLALNPDNAYAYRNLGLYYLEQQEPARALTYLDVAHDLDPATPELAHYRRLAQQAVSS